MGGPGSGRFPPKEEKYKNKNHNKKKFKIITIYIPEKAATALNAMSRLGIILNRSDFCRQAIEDALINFMKNHIIEKKYLEENNIPPGRAVEEFDNFIDQIFGINLPPVPKTLTELKEQYPEIKIKGRVDL